MSDIRNQCHILPFFISEMLNVKVEYSNLNEDGTTIRGVFCIKREINPRFRVFKSGEEVTDPVFYWVPAYEENSVFERGLRLIENGLGFPEKRSNLFSLFSKAPKKTGRKQ